MPSRGWTPAEASRPSARDVLCPVCGSFLDAPRNNPAPGRSERKCAACLSWHPLHAPLRGLGTLDGIRDGR